MEQNITTADTVQDVLEVANDLRIRLEDILESLGQMQASLNRYDELRM